MRTPPGLMGAAWLLWGWTAGRPWLGAAIGAGVEIARAVPVRWTLDDEDYERLWDILGLVFLAVAGFFLSSARVTERAGFLQWMPVIYLPMLLAQWWGPRDRIPFRTLMWLLRRWQRELPWSGGGVNITWPFWMLCLAAAAVPRRSDLVLYAGLGVLAAWALAAVRPRAWPRLVWLAALAAAWPVGLLVAYGLNDLQGRVEKAVDGWIVRRVVAGESDGSTAIGHIGGLKGSRRIVVRLKTVQGGPPGLLRQSVFSIHRNGTWYGADTGFRPVVPAGEHRWVLGPLPAAGGGRYEVRGFTGGPECALALPVRAAEIAGLRAWSLGTNRAGTVRAVGAPGFVRFEVCTAADARPASPPEPAETGDIPAAEREAFARLSRELGLAGAGADRVIAAVEAFFRTKFVYRTWNPAPSTGGRAAATPLTRFLFETRAGHCEYFATAAVLLLRQAGVPARYVTGYAVHEEDGRGGYVVRERDAHAWCEALRNGVWETLDTTPPDWRAAERGARPAWLGALADAWAALRFAAGAHLGGVLADRRVQWGVLAVAVLWLARRLVFRRRKGAEPAGVEAAGEADPVPEESVWHAAETLLERFECGRRTGETPRRWLDRVAGVAPVDVTPLRELLPEAYRLRYDPRAAPDGSAALRQRIDRWAGAAGDGTARG